MSHLTTVPDVFSGLFYTDIAELLNLNEEVRPLAHTLINAIILVEIIKKKKKRKAFYTAEMYLLVRHVISK